MVEKNMITLTERTIMKSRSGVYSDTSENRRKHRVGQKYGADKQPDIDDGFSITDTLINKFDSKDKIAIKRAIADSKKDGKIRYVFSSPDGDIGISTNSNGMGDKLLFTIGKEKTEKKEADPAKELEAVNKVIAAINEGKLNLPAAEVMKLSEKKQKLEAAMKQAEKINSGVKANEEKINEAQKKEEGSEKAPEGVSQQSYDSITKKARATQLGYTLNIDGKDVRVERTIDTSGGQRTPVYQIHGMEKKYWDLDKMISDYRKNNDAGKGKSDNDKEEVKETNKKIDEASKQKKYGNMNVEEAKKELLGKDLTITDIETGKTRTEKITSILIGSVRGHETVMARVEGGGTYPIKQINTGKAWKAWKLSLASETKEPEKKEESSSKKYSEMDIKEARKELLGKKITFKEYFFDGVDSYKDAVGEIKQVRLYGKEKQPVLSADFPNGDSVQISLKQLDERKALKYEIGFNENVGEEKTEKKEAEQKESTYEKADRVLKEAPIGAEASGGGYGPFKKEKDGVWVNKVTGRKFNGSLAEHIGGFSDFDIKGEKFEEKTEKKETDPEKERVSEIERVRNRIESLENMRRNLTPSVGKEKRNEIRNEIIDEKNRLKELLSRTRNKESKSEPKQSEAEESYSRIKFDDLPNSGKVNLKKYLSDKVKRTADENLGILSKVSTENLKKMEAGLVKEFNSQFDDFPKSRRAEKLYSIMKVKAELENRSKRQFDEFKTHTESLDDNALLAEGYQVGEEARKIHNRGFKNFEEQHEAQKVLKELEMKRQINENEQHRRMKLLDEKK